MNGRSVSAANFRRGFIATLLCFLGWASLADVSTHQQELASANCAFAFNLLQQLAAEEPGSNIFISPYSASTVLQMVSTGAVGTTKTEMVQALSTSDLTPAALNEANKEMGALINSPNTNFRLTAANAFWYQTGLPIKPAFIEGNEKYFGARVDGLNFGEETSVDTINAWASDETHGKIDQVLKWPLHPKPRLLLANAVYFLGNWETPFATNNTTDGVFSLSGGGQQTLPMMKRTGEFSYVQGNGYQAVQLPYKGGDLAMYVFLPDPDSSLDELLANMNGPWWQQAILSDFAGQWGTVVLPRFNLSCATDLVPPLEALGMKTAFTEDADFSNISTQSLSISAVKQQAVVEVDEKGTEAAAVTTVTIGPTVVILPTFEMTVDRPFLFFIVDQQAGTILFMGMVFDP